MQKENRNSIQGYVQLKRKDIWVKRYAQVDIEERSFSYKNSAKDIKIRHTIYLTDDAKIKRSKTENNIHIQKGTTCNRSSTDGVRLTFNKSQELEEWLYYLIAAQKGSSNNQPLHRNSTSIKSTQCSTAERAKESDRSPVESQNSTQKNLEFQLEQLVDASVLKKE